MRDFFCKMMHVCKIAIYKALSDIICWSLMTACIHVWDDVAMKMVNCCFLLFEKKKSLLNLHWIQTSSNWPERCQQRPQTPPERAPALFSTSIALTWNAPLTWDESASFNSMPTSTNGSAPLTRQRSFWTLCQDTRPRASLVSSSIYKPEITELTKFQKRSTLCYCTVETSNKFDKRTLELQRPLHEHTSSSSTLTSSRSSRTTERLKNQQEPAKTVRLLDDIYAKCFRFGVLVTESASKILDTTTLKKYQCNMCCMYASPKWR